MSGLFIIEDHADLNGIGHRTHDQIDSTLDQLLAASGIGQAVNQYIFTFTLTSALIVGNEISAGVISVPLPAGESMANYKTVEGYMDGRYCPNGIAWQTTVTGSTINIFVPTDPDTRNHYLAAGIIYDIIWTT